MPIIKKYLRCMLAFVTIGAFVFLACKGYCYYADPNEDGYCAIIMRGDFTGVPQTMPNSTGAWVGLTYVIRDLNSWEAKVDWYSVFLVSGYCLLIFQLIQVLPLLYTGLKKVSSKWLALALLLISGVLFGGNLLLWQLTSLSLLLSGLSLFKIWLNLKDKDRHALYSWGSYVFNILCFTYAACIRSEPVALSIAIWLPLVLLDYITGESLKKYTTFILPVAVIGCIAVAINTPLNGADSSYLAFRKYQFSFFDYKQPLSSLHITSPKDSMVFAAVNTAFISDSSQVNTAFFQRIGMMPMDKTPAAIPYYFRNLPVGPAKIKSACAKLIAVYPGFTILYLLCMLGGMLFVYHVAPKRFYPYFVSQLWPVVLFLGVTVFMKMENRVLVPMMWCFLIQNLVWCYFLTGSNTTSLSGGIMIAGAILLAAIPSSIPDMRNVCAQWNTKQYQEKRTDELVEEINMRSEKIIVVNDNACSKFYIRPFKPRYVFTGKKTVCLNYFQLFWLAGYGPYMQSVCGKSDLPGIVQSLSERKSEVIFVSKAARMELIKRYFKGIYDLDLPYGPINKAMPAINGHAENSNDVNLYRFI